MSNKMLTILLTIVLSGIFAAGPAYAFGPPGWADPYANKYIPKDSGVYAQTDQWVALYAEVEFSVTPDGFITRTRRFLLENMSDTEKEFVGLAACDQAREEISEVALLIQSKYMWHKMNVKQKTAVMSHSMGSSVHFVGSEAIPSHNRVVWEYSVRDKLKLFDWDYDYVAEIYPVIEKKIFISSEAAAAGCSLQLVDESGLQPAATFKKEGENCYRVSGIPSLDRVAVVDKYQPEMDGMFPYFIFLKPRGQGYVSQFGARYMERWEKAKAGTDAESIKTLAEKLASGAKSVHEKARTIADFVQFEIIYDSSYTKGEYGWIPLSPEEVLRSRRGDCKGKVMLAQELFKAAGITAEPVLLRYSEKYYPSPRGDLARSHFNHIILAVEADCAASGDARFISGPAKGMVAFDPTGKTYRLGATPPGLDGMWAFMPSRPETGVFEIHTESPSRWKTRVLLDVTFDEMKRMDVKVKILDNGLSPLPDIVEDTPGKELRIDKVKEFFSKIDPAVKVKKIETKKPPYSGELEFCAELCIDKPYLDMEQSVLFLNPLSIAVAAVGLQGESPARKPVRKEDAVVLGDPWNRRLNTEGFCSEIEIETTIKFDSAELFSSPQDRKLGGASFWMDYSEEWKSGGDKGLKGNVRILIPRGAWDPSRYKERQKQMEGLEKSFHAPLSGK